MKCKFCNKEYNSKNALAQHEIRCIYNDNHINIRANTDLEDLSKEDKNLLGHYIFLYPDLYKELYENNKHKYDNSGLKKYDIAKLSKKDTLKQLIEIDEEIQIKDGTWACPICGLHIKDMGAHVKSIHNLKWDDFKDAYKWQGSKIYFSETYRNNLRANKLNYYNNTEEGLQAKAELSKKFSGKNNPACRDDVKLKISKSKKGKCYLKPSDLERVSTATNLGIHSSNAKSYGYIFWSIINNKEVRFRSKTEYLISLMLDYYEIEYEYEPYKVEYFDPNMTYLRHYIPDYVIYNVLYEVKPSKKDFTDDKYILIQEQLNKSNKELRVLTPGDLYNEFKPKIAEKPLSYFENLIIENIRNGKCKLQLPLVRDADFYYNSPFLKKLGKNPKKEIEKGEKIYEDSKCNRTI